MAPSLTARVRASPLVSPRLISRAKNHRLLSVRCRSSGSPPVVRAVVSAVTELLRVLSPSKKPRQAVESVNTELELPRSMEDVVAVLEADYARAYFLTGRSRYSQNLDLLIPFFDSPSLQLESIEKGLRVDTNFVTATWTLRTYLRLPWRPLIAIRGNTTYDLDEEYKVIRHAESWDVSALEAIGQLFVPVPKQTGS